MGRAAGRPHGSRRIGYLPEERGLYPRMLRVRADAVVPVLFSSHQLDLVERLGDRVGIIKVGSMVAIASIDELRNRGGLRWRLQGPPAAAGWPGKVPGARVVRTERPLTAVELDRQGRADDSGQEPLQAALTVGPVHAFAPCRPRLVELHRHAVSDSTDPPTGSQAGEGTRP